MKSEISGRLAKWAIELGDHAIEYRPMTAFKGQILADFITETTSQEDDESSVQEKPTPCPNIKGGGSRP